MGSLVYYFNQIGRRVGKSKSITVYEGQDIGNMPDERRNLSAYMMQYNAALTPCIKKKYKYKYYILFHDAQ